MFLGCNVTRHATTELKRMTDTLAGATQQYDTTQKYSHVLEVHPDDIC